MADNIRRKCLKCGRSPKEDPGIKLYRFPNPGPTNILRCESWAKFCFPESEWYSQEFQKKVYAEHRMLCDKHFNESAFIDYANKKLNRDAIPDHCNEQVSVESQNSMEFVPGPSHILKDITNISPVAEKMPNKQSYHSIEPVPGPSSSKQKIEVLPRPLRKPMDTTNVKTVDKAINTCNQEKSERENKLYKKCRQYMKRICKLRNTIKNSKKIEKLNVLHENLSFQKLVKRLTPSFAILLQSQLKNVIKKTKGRRWTLEEKIISLRLYKRSPMCYRLLRRMWCLPTPATLKSLLSQFDLTVGINGKILCALKDQIKSLPSSDNEFILMFDEMSLKKHVQYNSKLDLIEGYQDHGLHHGRSAQEATHALVFMVAGIRKRIKQPIAFYLSSSYVTADRLAVLLKEVLHACFNNGISISATVCDMAGVNRKALTNLGSSIEKPYFTIMNNEVVAIFDPPHLLKCFRNLFMKYNVKCSTSIMSNDQKGQGLAKWEYIIDFFNIDNQNKNFVFAPTLRREHLMPNTREKMKVKLAAQVLSHSVAAGMFAKIAQGELPADATTTADLIANIDKLFDSLNSDSPDLRRGKPFSTNLSSKSPHLNFFIIMRKFFSSMEFVGCQRTPESQHGWIWSLNAVEQLWKNLSTKHKNIKSLATRRLQQDPLENLFGIIRGNCGSNSNPTAGQFIAALKTAIMSNLAHISCGNCEQDDNVSIIQNFKKILSPLHSFSDKREDGRQNSPLCLVTDSINESLVDSSTSTESAELQACAYVCGYLLKRQENKCEKCHSFLRSKNTQDELFIFLQFKEYNDMKKSLNYASNELVNCVESCATNINNLLRTGGHTVNIKKTIMEQLRKDVDFTFIKCHEKENMEFILNNVFSICIKRYCTIKNRQYHDETSSVSLRKKINIIKHK